MPDPSSVLSDLRTVEFDPRADVWLDADEFERQASGDDVASLEAAAGLFQGDFLDGFYDDWVIDERHRLEALYIGALERLMAAHAKAAAPEDTLSAALRLLDRDPLREDAHRRAMRAYAQMGQRGA